MDELSRLNLGEIRKIIHIDMDAFYASVEQRDNPSLKGVPLAVGHAEGRGVVAAASYEARRFGVRSAMPSLRAKKLCPGLVFVKPRFDVYKRVSAQMHEIFHEYTDIVEPISLDEAFLDVTVNKPGFPMAVTIAKEIKAKIREQLGLTASAGVSYNKFLAKIASDYRKPDGLCTIHPSQAIEFIHRIPVEDFWGVGPVTAARMHALGIWTGEQLAACSAELLNLEFGKSGQIFYQFARGIDNRPVEPLWTRKSVGCEMTLQQDLTTLEEIEHVIEDLADELVWRIGRSVFRGCTLTLKLKFSDFTQRSRSHTASRAYQSRDEIISSARQLLSLAPVAGRQVRLVGLSVSMPEHGGTSRTVYDPRQLEFDFENGYD
ncbi:MAG: DNA polymerase IV [Duncaniella sp.]|uniref:DNA polymerase IV n=1 Tax=Duncaniella sp. TaxID=2518496 RepID=UPI0023CDF6B0|nr:DNA polymerase IV [Duncaniella sp.]MDE5988484.1 DNA polymerase IV [Duncaniella sp.]